MSNRTNINMDQDLKDQIDKKFLKWKGTLLPKIVYMKDYLSYLLSLDKEQTLMV